MAALAIEYTPKTKITLCGSLGKKFGRQHNFFLGNGDVHEGMRAIDSNYPGFLRELASARERGLIFAVYRNGKNVTENEFGLGGCREIKIVPVITGSKRAGVLQTVIGVALIALAWWNPLGWSASTAMLVTSAGVANAAGGVIQMLSPQAKGLKTSAAPENTPGYAFGSARNTTASGNPVPLCLGRRRWGGAVISAAIYAEDQM
ncbi:MAG: tail assembly protein [Pseudomonas palmensis]|uniref:tail assembly protein n=1 Tax=Pseudomonas palmensis TaxID=2815362 RepID=UPI003D0D6289